MCLLFVISLSKRISVATYTTRLALLSLSLPLVSASFTPQKGPECLKLIYVQGGCKCANVLLSHLFVSQFKLKVSAISFNLLLQKERVEI